MLRIEARQDSPHDADHWGSPAARLAILDGLLETVVDLFG